MVNLVGCDILSQWELCYWAFREKGGGASWPNRPDAQAYLLCSISYPGDSGVTNSYTQWEYHGNTCHAWEDPPSKTWSHLTQQVDKRVSCLTALQQSWLLTTQGSLMGKDTSEGRYQVEEPPARSTTMAGDIKLAGWWERAHTCPKTQGYQVWGRCLPLGTMTVNWALWIIKCHTTKLLLYTGQKWL